MSTDFTQAQGGDELQRSIELSQRRGRPPCEVPGYEPRRFLGAGAYGEVWVAIDRTTGRQVAIKFYLHRGGLDWSLLSHEVEKLAFLSADRYVVQLLDVGWDAEPPYYVMEYVEAGSLEDRLRLHGRLPASQATTLFREIGVGLMHSHGKGVLHCDLKPANILLDQDGKPRLADFGQSRLSHDQTPALGTLFYMAPEQADPQAVPDARWDVYALGAIFYAMLTGHPPHRHAQAVTEIENAPHMEARLERYRQLITRAPPPTAHRAIRGVDKQLAAIISRCLSANPAERFPTAQAILDALAARDRRRSRRPLMVLGAIGPLLLLIVMSLFAHSWFNTSLGRSSDALTASAIGGLEFAARSVAVGVSDELTTRFAEVEQAARDSEVVAALSQLENDPQTRAVLEGLTKSQDNELVDQLAHWPQHKTLYTRLEHFDLPMQGKQVITASWFITDARGVQVARYISSPNTLGRCFAYRTYFHGGPADQPANWRPEPGQHVQTTRISAPYLSTTSDLWSVAISTPIFGDEVDGKKQFLGVIAVTFNVEKEFIHLPEESRQFAVLVDARDGRPPGLILQHPMFEKLAKASETGGTQISEKKYHVPTDVLARLKKGDADYSDPIGEDSQGTEYRSRYLAAQSPVQVGDAPTGWIVVVQDPYQAAIGGTLSDLRNDLITSGLAALATIAVVIVGLWWFVARMLSEPATRQIATAATRPSTLETLPLRRQET